MDFPRVTRLFETHQSRANDTRADALGYEIGCGPCREGFGHRDARGRSLTDYGATAIQ